MFRLSVVSQGFEKSHLIYSECLGAASMPHEWCSRAAPAQMRAVCDLPISLLRSFILSHPALR
jgi:hypothetical protein